MQLNQNFYMLMGLSGTAPVLVCQSRKKIKHRYAKIGIKQSVHYIRKHKPVQDLDQLSTKDRDSENKKARYVKSLDSLFVNYEGIWFEVPPEGAAKTVSRKSEPKAQQPEPEAESPEISDDDDSQLAFAEKIEREQKARSFGRPI